MIAQLPRRAVAGDHRSGADFEDMADRVVRRMGHVDDHTLPIQRPNDFLSHRRQSSVGALTTGRVAQFVTCVVGQRYHSNALCHKLV